MQGLESAEVDLSRELLSDGKQFFLYSNLHNGKTTAGSTEMGNSPTKWKDEVVNAIVAKQAELDAKNQVPGS